MGLKMKGPWFAMRFLKAYWSFIGTTLQFYGISYKSASAKVIIFFPLSWSSWVVIVNKQQSQWVFFLLYIPRFLFATLKLIWLHPGLNWSHCFSLKSSGTLKEGFLNTRTCARWKTNKHQNQNKEKKMTQTHLKTRWLSVMMGWRLICVLSSVCQTLCNVWRKSFCFRRMKYSFVKVLFIFIYRYFPHFLFYLFFSNFFQESFLSFCRGQNSTWRSPCFPARKTLEPFQKQTEKKNNWILLLFVT